MDKDEIRKPPHLTHEQTTPMMEIDIISKMFHDTMRHSLEEEGIVAGYRRLIVHLAHCSDITQSELTKSVHLSAPSVSVMIEKMERDGIVQKKNDETDGRQTRISLTPAGRELDSRILKCIRRSEEIALSTLNAEETAVLKKLLVRIYDNLEKNWKISNER